MSQTNKVVLVTGVTGAGKTTLLDFLNRRDGIQTWSADLYVKKLYENSSKLKSFIKEEFPSCLNDGVINKTSLGKIVFSGYEKLNTLNNFIQPLIKEEIEKIANKSEKIIVELKVYLDHPNIYENIFNKVIFIYSDNKEITKRIKEKFKYLEEEDLNRLIQKNIEQQLEILNKRSVLEKKGWIFLNNSDSLNSLENASINILSKI